MTIEEKLKVISDNLNRFNYSKRLFKINLKNSQEVVNEARKLGKTDAYFLLRKLGGFSDWERRIILS